MKLTTSLFDKYFIHNSSRMFTILVSFDDLSVPEEKNDIIKPPSLCYEFQKDDMLIKIQKKIHFLLDKYSYEEKFNQMLFCSESPKSFLLIKSC
jgi:hypothetical protein